MNKDNAKPSPRVAGRQGDGAGRPSIRLRDLIPKDDVKGGARWIFGVGERQAFEESEKSGGGPSEGAPGKRSD